MSIKLQYYSLFSFESKCDIFKIEKTGDRVNRQLGKRLRKCLTQSSIFSLKRKNVVTYDIFYLLVGVLVTHCHGWEGHFLQVTNLYIYVDWTFIVVKDTVDNHIDKHTNDSQHYKSPRNPVNR